MLQKLLTSSKSCGLEVFFKMWYYFWISQRKSHYNYRADFALEKFEKVKILVHHMYDEKMDKTHLQGLKNLRKKHFEWFRSEFKQKSHFGKYKKITKCAPKYRHFRYFLNFKISLVVRNGRWPAENRPGGSFFCTPPAHHKKNP